MSSTKSQILREKQQAIRDHKAAEERRVLQQQIESNRLGFVDHLLWGSPAFLLGALIALIAATVAGLTGDNYPLVISVAAGLAVAVASSSVFVKKNFGVLDSSTKVKALLFFQPFFLGAIVALFIVAVIQADNEEVFKVCVTALLPLIPVEMYFILRNAPRKYGVARRR